jgi:hypothetical protein
VLWLSSSVHSRRRERRRDEWLVLDGGGAGLDWSDGAELRKGTAVYNSMRASSLKCVPSDTKQLEGIYPISMSCESDVLTSGFLACPAQLLR